MMELVASFFFVVVSDNIMFIRAYDYSVPLVFSGYIWFEPLDIKIMLEVQKICNL